MENDKIDYIAPDYSPEEQEPYAPQKGMTESFAHGVGEAIGTSIKGVSWASDKLGSHWLDSTSHIIDVEQHSHRADEFNSYGTALGELATGAASVFIDPVAIAGAPALGALAETSAGVWGITKAAELASKSALFRGVAIASDKTLGFVTPVATQTASQLPYIVGASVNVNSKGVATLDSRVFAEQLATDAMFIGALHTVGKGVSAMWLKKSPVSTAAPNVDEELSREFADSTTSLEENRIGVQDVSIDDSAPVTPEGETAMQKSIDDALSPDILPEEQKVALASFIENPPDSGEIEFSIRPHPKAADVINEARDRASSVKKSISTPYTEFISALYSKFGVHLNGQIRSISDPEAIEVIKGAETTLKNFNKFRGARKVFMTEKFNEQLQRLHSTNPEMHAKLVALSKKYSKPIGMQNMGAKEARAEFRVDNNSGALVVNHPVYWLERNNLDMEHADEELLSSLQEKGEKSAQWFRAIINESDRSHSLNQKGDLLKEISRAINNFKDPIEQERIFQSQRQGFLEYGLSASDDDFNDVVREYEAQVAKHKDPESKFYHKLISNLRNEEKAESFFNYLECVLGA